ncbi:hypothetical protein DTQ70_23460 [Runella sp. SP2]|nr:hypothetical protein DTQ70_23460 [Runella sp. SP2]
MGTWSFLASVGTRLSVLASARAPGGSWSIDGFSLSVWAPGHSWQVFVPGFQFWPQHGHLVVPGRLMVLASAYGHLVIPGKCWYQAFSFGLSVGTWWFLVD